MSKSVQEEAQEIMDNFFNAIKDIEIDESNQNESMPLREDKEGKHSSQEFIYSFLENAPKKNKESILANKAQWK